MIIEIQTQTCDKLIKKFVTHICEYLDIQPTRVSIHGVDTLEGTNGFCYDETDDEFLIVVAEEGRDIGQIFGTLAHEMVHIKQYMNENLGYLLDNCQEIPYMERWWEKEAISMTPILIENFVTKLKCS